MRRQKRILVIDSRPEQLARAESALLADDWLVLASGRAEATHLLARTFRPELILLSADLWAEHAFELADTLHGDERTASIPLAMFSSRPEAVLVRAFRAGADLLLGDRFDADDLVQLEALSPRPGQQRLFQWINLCRLDGTLTVRAKGRSGFATFADGALVDAGFAGFTGEEALVAMVRANLVELAFAGAAELEQPVEVDVEVEVVEAPEHPWDLAA
ncbi:MAG: hypothetical protein ACK4N5_08435 [Myxococcales bacterium]